MRRPLEPGHITAVDPLATEYTELLRREGIVSLVQILPAEAEQLVTRFGHECFDLVHCANALDHSHDPFRAILEMMSVVKTGGYVLLRHFRREAENRGFTGLHQWNFDVREGRLLCGNAWEDTNLTDRLGNSAAVEARLEDDADYPGRRVPGAGAAVPEARRVLAVLRWRRCPVRLYRLDAWRERAMAGLELGLKARHGEPVAEVLRGEASRGAVDGDR